MFYSSKDSEQWQSVINEELVKVLKFCAANILSINFKKTNNMIVTSPKKKKYIRIITFDIEQKPQIKYLGVFIDEHLKWDAQLQHVNNKITKIIGVLFLKSLDIICIWVHPNNCTILSFIIYSKYFPDSDCLKAHT